MARMDATAELSSDPIPGDIMLGRMIAAAIAAIRIAIDIPSTFGTVIFFGGFMAAL